MKKPIIIAVITLLIACSSCKAKITYSKTDASVSSSSDIFSNTESPAASVQASDVLSRPEISSSKSSVSIAISNVSAIIKTASSAAGSKIKGTSSLVPSISSKQDSDFKSSLISENEEIPYDSAYTPYQYPDTHLTGDEYADLQNNGQIYITDTGPSQGWIPTDEQAEMSKVIDLLQQSTSYTDSIPIPKYSIAPLTAAGQVCDTLYIYELKVSDNPILTVYPASCIAPGNQTVSVNGTINGVTGFFLIKGAQTVNIQDVLEINFEGHKWYIKSSQLYSWLKNDEWKSEFKVGYLSR